MAESISQIIIILLSIAGIVYIWKNFLIFILRSKNDNAVYVIIPINDSLDCAEQLVRSTAERTILMGKSKWDKVVCVDYGCNEMTKIIIEKLCKEYSFLDYMSDKAFEKIFVK